MERLHFAQVVEGLWVRALAGRIGPELNRELIAAGLDLTRPLLPAYPAEKISQWVRLTSRSLYPHLDETEAQRRLGGDFFRGFTQTLIGKALVAMMKVIGTRRSLERMQRNFRTGTNFIDTRFTSLGKGRAELWMNDVDGLPAYYAGIVEEGGRATGARDMKTTWEHHADGGCTYQVTWSEPG